MYLRFRACLNRNGDTDDKTKSLALGVLGKFLQCTSPDVSFMFILFLCLFGFTLLTFSDVLSLDLTDE